MEPLLLFLIPNTINLISYLLNINERDRGGNTVLHYLSEQNDTALVEWAINQGTDVNVVNRYGITPLNFASQMGDFDIVETLLKYGIT